MTTTSTTPANPDFDDDPTVAKLAILNAENGVLRDENAALKRRVAWFERQLFGQKSEKRPVDNAHQPSLLGDVPPPVEPEGEKATVTYQRGAQATSGGLRQ